MKTFINQLSGRSAFGLITLTALLILLCVSQQTSAQAVSTAHAESSVSGLLSDGNSQSIAFGLVRLIKISDATVFEELLTNEQGSYSFNNISHGTYLVRASAFGCFGETSSKPIVINNESDMLNIPAIKMERNVSPVKYWQTGWYQPFINSGKSNQKDTTKNNITEKYWQMDWFNNVP
jgi:hypothetical protein